MLRMRDWPSKKDNLSQNNHLVRPGSFDRMGEDHPAALGDCEEEDAFFWQPWSFLLTFLYQDKKVRPVRRGQKNQKCQPKRIEITQKHSASSVRSHINTFANILPRTVSPVCTRIHGLTPAVIDIPRLQRSLFLQKESLQNCKVC